MIDLHCHILPGIDDGPELLDESIEMCRIAANDGISKLVCTPHHVIGKYTNTREKILGACPRIHGYKKIGRLELSLLDGRAAFLGK